MRAKCVINATGPFTDSLRQMDKQEISNICQPSAGVHIVIPGYYRYRRNMTLVAVSYALTCPRLSLCFLIPLCK